jgi:ATP-dependent Clp protease ATP-binding subunit ClpC
MNLDVSQLIAGTSFRGEFESRLKEIIKEMSDQKDIILFIDEMHTIVGAGNIAGGLDLANILKPSLARGEIQIIGATTFSEYKKYIEKDAALERRFQPIHLGEPAREEAEKILFGIRQNYESFHNVIISDEAIRVAVDLSMRYIKNRFLPDKAIDVIDEAASFVRSQEKISSSFNRIARLEDEKKTLAEKKERAVEEENYREALDLRNAEEKIHSQLDMMRKNSSPQFFGQTLAIGVQDVIETVSKISKIPAEKISQENNRRIKNIRKIMETRIVGQQEAVEKITSALLRSQSGIGNIEKPLGSFLFLGPTGVGKTLTAKILAQEFFGYHASADDSLIRIDMSELMERHSVSSLIGSPAGYIGYGEGGRLTEKVRRKPYAVILYDDIEKAHPDVFNNLLQIQENDNQKDTECDRA